MIIPLLALAAIAVILFLAWPRKPAPEKTVPWEGRIRPPEESARIAIELRDALDRTPFGAPLAAAIWDALIRHPPNHGVIVEFHRDYCGHGLIRTPDGVMLAEVQDGGQYFAPVLHEWTDESEFVAFLARQSDFSCSGWDPAEPLFFTDDDWNRNNQRLTRAALAHFLARPPPGS